MKKTYQEPTRPCPSCGKENRISSPFCTDCGSRMYPDGTSPAQQVNPKRVARKHAFRSFVNSLLFITLVTLFGLAFWPYAAVEIPMSSDNNGQVERYLEEMSRRRAAGIEIPPAIFSQGNLNAFLGQNTDPEASKLLGTLLSETGILLLSNEPMGPFHLSTRLVLKPEEGTETPFVPSRFWVGHLPLPVSLAPTWTQRLADRFDLDLDAELWEELRIKQVTRDGVIVEFLRTP